VDLLPKHPNEKKTKGELERRKLKGRADVQGHASEVAKGKLLG